MRMQTVKQFHKKSQSKEALILFSANLMESGLFCA